MKKWIIIIVVVVVAVAFFSYKYHQNNRPKPVSVIQVTRGDIVETATAVGNIVPAHSITVKSHLAGIVEATFHDAGDAISRNDKLLQIKPDPTPQDYAQAISLVSQDQADVSSLKQKVKNFEMLIEEGIIKSNFSDYLSTKQSLENAQAKLLYDEQFLALLTKGSTTIEGQPVESVILSPVDGFILQRNIDIGDPVISLASAQASTVLFTIANMNDLIFKGSVDEIDSARLHQGMPAVITVAAITEGKITGKLTKLALQSDAQNKVTNSESSSTSPFNVGFQVEISDLKIPEDLTLRSGYSATADIIIHEVKNVLLLPERALLFKGGKTFVMLPAQENAKFELKEVTTGLSDGIYIEIKAGLAENQSVVDSPDENV